MKKHWEGSAAWPDDKPMAAPAVTPENRFLAAASGGRNCFLNGMAETGKSTLLKQFISESSRHVDITAPTGVAALNVGGMTIHRFCGMLLGPQAGQSNDDYFAVRGRDEPFGGCQVIAPGDFLPLPPVRRGDREPHDWAFQSPAWKPAEFKMLILETVRREEQPLFVRALAQFRIGDVWGDTARLLQSRVRTPAGLGFKEWLKGLHVSPEAIRFYKEGA